MTITTLHHLRIHSEPFRAIVNLEKRADFRRIDRPICTDEFVLLNEWIPDESPTGGHFTGNSVLVRCCHVQVGEQYGIPKGYAIYSWDVMAATRPVPQAMNLETAVR